ncbi:Two-component response regulator, CheY subfamily [Hyella patelloides LEGE 07179]|uniref:Two-component response regulator, CheY subfamily n=1 Tax=Hyella patelloides LEGE 07179 TaxID=945734 RepID=A0A563W4U1_9CYAN|nr:response regulator [Hyella patelloides]VEP18719.1 Two-component response regulator, CheY subfamily [Hyella patelloides LEGE 07179]
MSHKQILIVDDDDTVRATVEFSLEVTTNWKILTACSGKEGLSLAQSKSPDLIILDVMMPVLDGIEVLQQLRTNISTQKIPVIFLTAKTLTQEQQKLKNLGVQGIISKPFDAINLEKQICLLLDW